LRNIVLATEELVYDFISRDEVDVSIPGFPDGDIIPAGPAPVVNSDTRKNICVCIKVRRYGRDLILLNPLDRIVDEDVVANILPGSPRTGSANPYSTSLVVLPSFFRGL